MTFAEVFERDEGRYGLIGTLMALLEMMKQGYVRAVQDGVLGEIRISFVGGDDVTSERILAGIDAEAERRRAAEAAAAGENGTNGTELFTAAGHGMITGDGPVRVANAGGALPAGLVAATDYWVIWVSANTFRLATSFANALAGTYVSITTDGTGTQTLSDTADTELMKWREYGVVRSGPTMSLRQGFFEVIDHDPRIVAYGLTWTGGTTNALRAVMVPRVEI